MTSLKRVCVGLCSIIMFSLVSCGGNSSNTNNSSSAPSSTSIPPIYTVTFLNYDETVLATKRVYEGRDATYPNDAPTPEKPSTNEKVYTFSGWDQNLTNVQSSFSTIAQYSEETRYYAIVWEDGSGNVLKEESLEYGVTPNYIGATPTKQSTSTSSYTFTGWSPAVVAVVADATYVAQFSESLIFSVEYLAASESYKITQCPDVSVMNIPASYDDGTHGVHPVTHIQDNVNVHNTKMTSLIIPSTITSLSNIAFYGCSSLTSITVDSANTIYKSAGNCIIEIATKTLVFGCKTSIIPSDGSVTILGSNCFDAMGLTSISIPNTILKIKDSVFLDNKNMTNVTFEATSSLTFIGYYAFFGCSSLPSIVLPDSLTTIDVRVFEGCTALTSIIIPKNVTSIANNPFCFTGLTSISVASGNTTFAVVDGCLYNISTKILICGLATAIIPSDGSITTLGGYSFARNPLLTSLIVSEGVTTINSYAFFESTSLTTLALPKSLTFIDPIALAGVTGLTSLSVTSGGTYSSVGNCILSNGGTYLVVGCNSSTIPSGVTTLGAFCFFDADLTSLSIPNTVTSIETWAISGSRHLPFVVIPSSVEMMATGVFYNIGSEMIIYCEATSIPAGWNTTWYGSVTNNKIKWFSSSSNTDGSHWHYVDGVPTVWVA